MLESPHAAQEVKMIVKTGFQRGMYFEEFEIGQELKTPARTITETDIVNFAGVSGDFTSIHTDAVYTETTQLGQRVAHGLLIISVVTGLAARSGFLEGTALALREITDWKFSSPVFIGDTIHAKFIVEEKKPFPRLGGGAVILSVRVVNQEEKVVMRGKFNLLMLSQP
jgi:acyl dehydratase